MSQEPGTGTIEELLAHREWARSLARCLVRGDAAVEDVVQQAYLRAMVYGFPAAAKQRQWLGQVIRNVVRRGWQVEEGERRRQELAAPREAFQPAADELVEQVELQRRLADNVLALDEPYRTVVILRYFEDLPPVEIAARVGAPVQTVRTRLKRALKQLRQRFDDTERGAGNAWHLQALALAQGLRSARTGAASELVFGDGRPGAGAKWLRGWASRHAALFVVMTLFVLAGGIALVTLTGNRGSTGELSVVAGVLPAATGNISSPVDGIAGRPEPQPLAADVVPARRVTGRVLNLETGKPVADAVVRVRIYDDKLWVAGNAETRSDGVFSLSCNLPEAVSDEPVADDEDFLWRTGIDVHAPELAPHRRNIDDKSAITKAWHEGAAANLGDITLERGTKIFGRVTSSKSGAGVADGRLYLCHPYDNYDALVRAVPVGTTDADGNFELTERILAVREAPWTYYLVVRSRSCGMGWTSLAVAPSEDQQEVKLVIAAGCTLTVRVIGVDGLPVPHPTVTVTPLWSPLSVSFGWLVKPHSADYMGWEALIMEDLIRVTGGEDGVAVFTRLPAVPTPLAMPSSNDTMDCGGGLYSVCASSRAGLHGDLAPRELTLEKGLALVITAKPPVSESTIVGRILDSEGRPLQGATVMAPVNGVSRKFATTDAQGDFSLTFPRVDSDEVTCRIDAARYASREEVVKVAPGGEARLDCALREERPLGGIIEDEEGHPIQGVRVYARPADVASGQYPLAPQRLTNGVRMQEPTAIDGRFRIEGATAGRWSLTVHPPDGLAWAKSYSFTVDGASDDIELTLRHVKRLATAVMVRAFDAVSREDVELCATSVCWLLGKAPDDYLEPEPVITADERSVSIPHLEPGWWRLWVLAPGGATGQVDLEITEATAGTTIEREVGVGASSRIEGFVSGAREGVVELRLVGPKQPFEWQKTFPDEELPTTLCADDGSFSFTGLVGGAYDLKHSAGNKVAIARVTVPAGASAKAVLGVRPGGVVHFENLSATEAVRLAVEYANGFFEERILFSSSSDERIAVLSFPEGPVRWTACSTRWPAFRADEHTVSGTVDVTAGSEVTVPLILPE